MKRSLRNIFLLMIIFNILFLVKSNDIVYADNTIEDIINHEINKTNLSKIEKEAPKDFNIKDKIRSYSLGENNFNIENLFKKFFELSFKEIKDNFSLLVKILLLSIISGIMKILLENMKEKSVSEIASFAIYILAVIVIYRMFINIKELAEEILLTTIRIMKISMPTMITMLIASGKIKTAAFFEPITFSIINIVSFFVIKFILPIILLLANLVVVNGISNKPIVSELIKGIKDSISIILKTGMTLIFGLSQISKLTSSVFDGGMKEIVGKSISSIIPIVGSSMDATLSIFLNCTNIIKNSTGIVIIVLIITVIGLPLIKLMAMIIICRFASIIIEPIAEKKIKTLFSQVSEVISLIFTSIILIEGIFVINITMMFS